MSCLALMTGCTFSESQQLILARTSGTIAMATWRSVDNPSIDEIQSMKDVIEFIEGKCTDGCGESGSYYMQIYPLVDEHIDKNVRLNNRPICKLGAAFALTSIDTLFAANIDWNKNMERAFEIIKAFCEGAQVGLFLPPEDAVITATHRQAEVRMLIKNN